MTDLHDTIDKSTLFEHLRLMERSILLQQDQLSTRFDKHEAMDAERIAKLDRRLQADAEAISNQIREMQSIKTQVRIGAAGVSLVATVLVLVVIEAIKTFFGF